MIQSTTGNILEIGDKVKINLPVLEKYVEEWGSDGIEFTTTGKNYLRYIRQHPDEVYTVTDIDFTKCGVKPRALLWGYKLRKKSSYTIQWF